MFNEIEPGLPGAARMKILLAVDGSEYSARMLAYLATHRESLGPHNAYTVLHGVLPVPPHAASFVSKTVLQTYYDDEAAKVLDPIRAQLKNEGIQAEFIHRAGPPAQVIADVAREGHFDMVVMGSHGQGALGNLVLGSVATKVLAQCSVPVLLVR